MHLPEDPETPLSINIVPMIDVVFAVLAFFILSSLYLTRAEGVPVTLPGAQSAAGQPQQRIVLTIDEQGDLFLGDAAVEDDQLLEAIQSLEPMAEGGVIVIRADAAVSHGRVVTVMDRLRTLEGIQLAIATQPETPDTIQP
jgi:biopolymer transport protein ExbD